MVPAGIKWRKKNNLVILYPQVPSGTNPLACWSWYLPENQRADSGQLKMIADQVLSIRKSLKLGNTKTYITGISSGGATVAGLLACFPQMFSAGAIHSGPSYGLAQSLENANKILKNGPLNSQVSAFCKPQEFSGSIMVIQGERDSVVNPKNALRIISDFIGNTNTISKSENGKDLYSIADFKSSKGSRERLILAKELDHAWSGFVHNLQNASILGPSGQLPTKIPFFSELGPSATNLIWKFFLQSSTSPTAENPHNKSRLKGQTEVVN